MTAMGGEVPSAEKVLSQAQACWPLAPAAVLYWSAQGAPAPTEWNALGYAVCQGENELLCDTDKTPHLGWRRPVEDTLRFALIWLDGLTPQVNALAALQVALDALDDGGRIMLGFAATHDHDARLPEWRTYWWRIAERLGLKRLHPSLDVPCLVRAERAPRWQIRLATARDMPSIQALFAAVFGHELSAQAWAWKYAQGRGNAILAYQAGELVAHYGALYRDIEVNGQRDWALQVVDVMVHPKHRGVMTKQGAFFLMTATWDEVYGPLAFGFPTARHMQLGQRLGIYADAGAMVELRWQPENARPRLMTHLVSVDLSLATHREKVAALWQAMRADLSERVVGERGPQWLAHRFMQHPHRRYEVLAVSRRLGGAWDGVIVWRDEAGRIEVLDLIAPLRAIPRLIDHARRICALRGCREVYMWMAAASAAWVQTAGATVHDTEMRIPTDCWTGAPAARGLIDRWWLTGGDTDFR